ncbi:MAG: hypothetical protein QOF48_2527 [Verrucomicrobiota bacterium]|jgi:predicted RNA-binding protein with PUA-like domain
MPRQCWLVKQEPESYSWANFVKDGLIAWTGIRSFPARKNLRSMKKGDAVLYYHSVTEKRVMGLARVEREAYPDPTATEGEWACVDLVVIKGLNQPVDLEAIKEDKILREMPFLKQTRLSVAPVSPEQFTRLLALAKTRED